MKLLETFKIKDLELKNRVVMPPMDTYSAKHGYVNRYHTSHYGARAIGGVALIIQEATAVRKDGRISSDDLGIWSNKFVGGLTEIVETVHQLGAKIGIQLCDAGRKTADKNATVVWSSTNEPFSGVYKTPKEMTKEDIKESIKLFTDAAKRAIEAGYDLIEIHAAHGYLVNQFISPLINKRTDEYGKDRYLFLREIVEEIRKFYNGVLSVRFSAYEWVDGGVTPEDIYDGIKDFIDQIDILDVSTGSTVNDGILPFRPGYQVEFALKLKELSNKPVIAVGMIDNFDVAEYIRWEGIDLVAFGRALLRNPNFVKEETFKNDIDFKVSKPIQRAYFRERFVEKNIKR